MVSLFVLFVWLTVISVAVVCWLCAPAKSLPTTPYTRRMLLNMLDSNSRVSFGAVLKKRFRTFELTRGGMNLSAWGVFLCHI